MGSLATAALAERKCDPGWGKTAPKMLIRLDYASSIGLAEQIAGAVRQSIRDGVLSAGEGLPAARALASVLGVNVHTVFRAYSLLRVAGVVEVRQGRGARVLPPPEELPKDVVDAIEALVRGAASRGVVRQQLIRYLEEMS